ncbi:DEAD/DEAH box helicase [Candidatus Woesearchaeota archaeon]|nr:DEAD/DEAH box helicase [Candidatus Woesearchaeota archaeon]
MIKDFEPRLYQQTIFATAVQKNTLVVLPTGMGKTNIFLMLAAQRLRQYPDSKILLLGPTRPLIDQYYNVFLNHFDVAEEEMEIFTGYVKPEKRGELWKKAKIVFSTPQGLENDVLSKRIHLEDVSLLGFDEAHKAVGNYAYVWLAEQYERFSKYPRIVGMTASPGSDAEKITEVCSNLHIEAIEVRTDEDPDVRPYIQPIKMNWIDVELPQSFLQIKKYLDDCIKSKLKEIVKNGYLNSDKVRYINRRELLGLQAELQARIAQGERDFEVMRSISLAAEALKAHHALELLETQGIAPLHKYMKKMWSQSHTTKTKALKNLVMDLNFRSAYVLVEKLQSSNIEHPKLPKLTQIVKEKLNQASDMKMIVFTQYRDSGLEIQRKLKSIEGITPKLFVGQQRKADTGMTQKQQKEVLDDFRNGGFNVLVATQIAEEGLDIPQVDYVVFYEPIPSAIRFIQRKGRTGRQEKGEVIVLTAKKTRDEAYKWAARSKQKRMYRALEQMKKKLVLDKPKQGLKQYIDVPDEEMVCVFADYREKGSSVMHELIALGVDLKLESLKSADYLLSDRIGVELKSVPDFINSLIDQRLLVQLKELKMNFLNPIVVVEGTEDIFAVRNVHPNAIRGLMATVIVDYQIPILFSRNSKETAAMLHIIAKHEQLDNKREVMLHGVKKPQTLKEQQEYVVSSLPGVGGKLAKEMLKQFGSVKGVLLASEEDLKEVEKIGEKKAKRIRKIAESEYNG